MPKEIKQVLRFKCPDCGATLQGEVDDGGDFVVSVYEKGKPKDSDDPGVKGKTKGAFLEFLFKPPLSGGKVDDK